jgi:unconventional prefoldin RPB5 interactor 1
MIRRIICYLETNPHVIDALRRVSQPTDDPHNMALPVKDSFLDLERHRQLLEGNIENLRISLLHWQTWEAEYEGLKEEILSAKPTPNRAQLLAIGHAYEGDLVTRKEVEDILGLATSRSATQVVNILDRRLDYVEQNVRTVEKQIETVENKLAAASVISTPDVRNEDGLPLTEIMEELDDEGNIISSHLSTPGSTKPQILEVLKKAGIMNLPADTLSDENKLPGPEASLELKDSPHVNEVQPQLKTKPTRKGVSFAEDTKPGPEPQKSRTAKRLEDIMKLARQSEARISEPPVIPKNESAEDAALRQQMLQYGMSEVGAVVAELELEEDSDLTDDDYDLDDASSVDDDEDAFGRSTRQVVTDEIRQRMIELEERLGVRAMQNIGKKAGEYEAVDEGIGRVAITNPNKSDTTSKHSIMDKSSRIREDTSTRNIPAKKPARFSEECDRAPDAQDKEATLPMTEKIAPVNDIVERTVPVQATAPTFEDKTLRLKPAQKQNVLNGPLASSNTMLPLVPAKSAKPKPFSTPIQFTPAVDSSHTVPTGPEGKVLATTVVERGFPVGAAAVIPDELDPRLLNQEVATEYYKMRNKMISRQGGFMKEEESEIVPFAEEEGGLKKMSRFKAARLTRS